MSKSFKIITLGCKVNQYESAYIEEALIREGYFISGNKKPDMAIINTCIVTQKAAYQSRQAIRKAIRENPSGVIAAIGCYAQVFPEELLESEGIKVRHYMMVDDYFTWWDKGRSYLCRLVDMLHMGYVDEVLFGYKVVERLPTLVREWVNIAHSTILS